MIYLDANATAPAVPEAVDAAAAALDAGFANPSSAHAPGRAARCLVEDAREAVAALVGADPADVVFTSGGTEAIALAIRGAIAGARASGRRRIVTSAVEHPAVAGTVEALVAAGDATAAVVGVDREGRLDLGALEAALARDDVALASFVWASSETGLLSPIAEIAARCRARAVPLHVDAVQVAGRLPIDLRAIGADLLSISAHKLGGPKGAGALVARRGAALAPLLRGGPQERGLRAGTENVPGIAGFGAACRAAARALREGAWERVRALRDRLEAALLATIPDAARNGAAAPRLPNTTSLRFAGVDGAALVRELSRRGVCASTGSACASGSLEPSPALTAMGVTPEEARGALRLSLPREVAEGDIEAAAAAIRDAVRLLRALEAAPAARPIERSNRHAH